MKARVRDLFHRRKGLVRRHEAVLALGVARFLGIAHPDELDVAEPWELDGQRDLPESLTGADVEAQGVIPADVGRIGRDDV
jgi:hypothetical protein